MPDVQISPTVETRDYLNIAETADRSRLAVKTLYNWISFGRLGPASLARRGFRPAHTKNPSNDSSLRRNRIAEDGVE